MFRIQEQTCNISPVVLWGWKYIVEPRYLTHLLLLLALWCCLSFEWPWNNSVSFSIFRATVSETGVMNSFWPHCTMYIQGSFHWTICRSSSIWKSLISHLYRHQQSWQLFSFITDPQLESRASLPHYKFCVILLWYWVQDLSQNWGSSPSFLGNGLAAPRDQRKVQERRH